MHDIAANQPAACSGGEGMSEASLELLLNCAYGTEAAPAQLSQADTALIKHEFAEAAQLYAAQPEALDMRAKRGFCLAMMGRDEEAETLLTVGNAGEHPLARAILAWMLAGPYGQRLRGGFGTKEQLEARAQRREIGRASWRERGWQYV